MNAHRDWYVVVRADPGAVACGALPSQYLTLPPPVRGRGGAERAAIDHEASEGGWGARVDHRGRLRRVRYTRVVGPFPTRAAARAYRRTVE